MGAEKVYNSCLVVLRINYYFFNITVIVIFNYWKVFSSENRFSQTQAVVCIMAYMNYLAYYDCLFIDLIIFLTGYISMVYHESKRRRAETTPGQTPVVKKGSSQTQLNVSVSEMSEDERIKAAVPSDPTVSPYLVTYSQDLVSGDLTEQMFRY